MRSVRLENAAIRQTGHAGEEVWERPLPEMPIVYMRLGGDPWRNGLTVAKTRARVELSVGGVLWWLAESWSGTSVNGRGRASLLRRWWRSPLPRARREPDRVDVRR